MRMIEMGFPMNRLHQNWTMAYKVVTSITCGINTWQKHPDKQGGETALLGL